MFFSLHNVDKKNVKITQLKKNIYCESKMAVQNPVSQAARIVEDVLHNQVCAGLQQRVRRQQHL